MDLQTSGEEELRDIDTIGGEKQSIATKESTETQKQLDAIRSIHHYFVKDLRKAMDALRDRLQNLGK